MEFVGEISKTIATHPHDQWYILDFTSKSENTCAVLETLCHYMIYEGWYS